MLSLNVPDTCYWVLQTLNFNAADVEFQCCRLVILSFVSKRTEGGLLMLDVACNTVATWSQYSRNMGGREERLLMLDVASNRVRNIFTTRSQHLLGSI
jgi:hypothetical protein